jgi:hypothetical protein
MPRRRRALITPVTLVWVGGGTLITTFVVALAGLTSVALAAAGLAVLILPGLALAIIHRPSRALRRLDLFLIGAALSLACVVIGGLVLNLLPFGLGRASWLGLTAVLLIAIAALARDTLPPLRSESWVRPRAGQVVAMAAAGALVVLALVIARAGVKQPAEPFTAVWIAPASSGVVQIGLDNREGAPMSYRVDVTVDGSVEATFPVALEPGERWTTPLPVPNPSGPRTEVLVYLDSAPGVVYRRVTLAAGGAVPGTGS